MTGGGRGAWPRARADACTEVQAAASCRCGGRALAWCCLFPAPTLRSGGPACAPRTRSPGLRSFVHPLLPRSDPAVCVARSFIHSLLRSMLFLWASPWASSIRSVCVAGAWCCGTRAPHGGLGRPPGTAGSATAVAAGGAGRRGDSVVASPLVTQGGRHLLPASGALRPPCARACHSPRTFPTPPCLRFPDRKPSLSQKVLEHRT